MKKFYALLMLCALLIGGTVSAQVGPGKGGDDPTPTPAPEEEETTTTETSLLITIAEPDADEVNAMLEQGSQPVTASNLALYEKFDSQDAWELYDDGEALLKIENGQYVLFAPEDYGFIWGQNEDMHTDIVFQVVTEQLSDEDDNGFGLMCRANPENTGAGYHFWISGDGYAMIALITDDDAELLVEWETQDNLNLGQAQNEITAVCSGNYLALYINGELALETTDNSLTEGVAGFAATSYVEGTYVEVAFDEARIWEASSDGGSGTSLGGLIGSSDGSEEQDEPEEEQQEGGLSGLFGDDDDTDSGQSDDAARVALEDTLTQSGDLTLGDLLRLETFDSEDAWELYEFDDGSGYLRVEDGQYEIYNEDDGILWGQDTEIYSDVVIEVDTALPSDQVNGYGIMCRADPANTLDGYHFFISGDGYYAIAVSVDGDVDTLVDFTRSSAINYGPEENHLTVVCVDDYLALYINNELVEEITDSTYSEGAVGLTTVKFEDSGNLTATFDNVRIWDVSR